MFEMLQEDKSRPETFASDEPPRESFGNLVVTAAKTALTAPTDPMGLFRAAERQVRLADNAFSAARSTEEAYERQIAQIKQATGQQLENPLRGGYALEARKRIKDEMFAGGGVRSLDTAGGEPEYRIRVFNEKLAELRQKNPDLPDFDLRKEATSIAAEAEAGLETAAGQQQNPIASLGLQFLGGMWAGRRDPLFVSSMFVGPTGAVGKTALARIVSSGMVQGLYNAGLSAIQQPAVQAWRQEAALRSGVEPALENIGMAFLSGLIPGASIQGAKEMLGKGERELIERVVSGRAKAGEAEAATKIIDDVLERAHVAQREALSPIEKRAVKMGEEMQEADRVVLPEKVSSAAYADPQLHNDMTAAALKRADDPAAPSPEAIQFFDVYHGSPHEFEAFDVSRIGTGEGAQSYGHGLYFAEHPATADDYKRRLGGDPAHRIVDHYDTSEFDEKQHGAIYARASNNTLLGTITRQRDEGESGFRVLAEGPAGMRLNEIVKSIDEAKSLINNFSLNNRAGGHLYRVRIRADKEHFLDWDKPLNAQTPELQTKLKAAMGEARWNEFQAADVRTAMDNGLIGFTKEETTKKLREAGIPGIKYLDQGSRNTEGEGTRNFVIFDDKILEITHKNDMPVGAPEIAARVEEARPQNMHQAQVAADEALDDFGRQRGMTVAQDQMAEQAAARASFVIPAEEAQKVARGDPMGKIPYIDDSTRIGKDGKPSFITSIDKVGSREDEIGMLIRSCK